MRNKNLKLGKKKGTLGISNSLWIKKFENGVKIRAKGEGEITLGTFEVYELLLFLRKFPSEFGGTRFFCHYDLSPIYNKYPNTEKFIMSLINNEISDVELKKFRKRYEKKKREALKMKNLKELMLNKLEGLK